MPPVRDLVRRGVEYYLSSRVLRVIAVTALLYFVIGHSWWFPGADPWVKYRIDYDVYRLGGEVLRAGEDLYGYLPDTRVGVRLPFTYPPIAAVLFAGLSLLPFTVGSVLVTLLTCASVLAVVWLVLRELGADRRAAGWLMVPIGIVALQVMPVRETIEFGQINAILMALVAVDLFVGRGRWWQGSLVGLALAIKLTPAVFLAYFLMRRDWAALAAGVSSALVYTAVGFLVTPHDSAIYWAHALRDPSRIGEPGFASNQSLTGALARAGIDSTALWFLLCAALGLACLVLMARLFRHGHDAMAATTMGLYALIASPVSWGHHWVWSIPAVMIVAFWAWRWLPAVRAWGLAGFAGLGTWVYWNAPHWFFPQPGEEVTGWSAWEQVVGSAYLWWALAALACAWALAPRVVVAPVRVTPPTTVEKPSP